MTQWIVKVATKSIWEYDNKEPAISEEEHSTEKEAKERVEYLKKHPVDFFDHIKQEVLDVYEKKIQGDM